MKSLPPRRTTSLLLGLLVTTGLSAAPAAPKNENPHANKPTVITPPAVKDGTAEATRAPFPSSRQFDNDKGPNPKALENAPDSTPATEPRVAPPTDVRVKREMPAPNDTKVTLPAPADPGSLPTGRTTAAVATTIDPKLGRSIRDTTVATRDQLMTDIESRITASENAVSAINKTTREMSAAGREQFRAASDDVKEKAKALKKSMQAARKASGPEWESARTQLAADYDAYVAALARIDTASAAAPVQP